MRTSLANDVLFGFLHGKKAEAKARRVTPGFKRLTGWNVYHETHSEFCPTPIILIREVSS